MHHYGEVAVEVEIHKNNFNIILKNHLTGAAISVSGPTSGVFESRERILDRMTAEVLGREIAHV